MRDALMKRHHNQGCVKRHAAIALVFMKRLVWIGSAVRLTELR